MADKGQRQRQRRDDHQALVAAAEHGVEADQDKRKDDDGGPARLEGLQEEGDGAGKVAAHDQFDRKNQDGGGEKADEAIADDRPFPARQIAGGRIAFQKLWRGFANAFPSPCHLTIPPTIHKSVIELSSICHEKLTPVAEIRRASKRIVSDFHHE